METVRCAPDLDRCGANPSPTRTGRQFEGLGDGDDGGVDGGALGAWPT